MSSVHPQALYSLETIVFRVHRSNLCILSDVLLSIGVVELRK